jgi:molybdopterin converting factor small subunit
MLRGIVAGAGEVPVEAPTVQGALEDLIRIHPALGVHLFDESGELRRHVLCFHNGTNSRWFDRTKAAIGDGDVLSIIQAVSGG